MKFLFLIFISNLISISTLGQSLSEHLNPAFKAYQDGQYDLAKEQFLKVLETDNDNSFILYNLGLAEYKLGNIGYALGLWSKALHLDPSLKEARSAIEYTLGILDPKPEQTELDTALDVLRYNVLPFLSIHVIFFLSALALFFFWRRLVKDLVVRRQAVADKMVPPGFSNLMFVWATVFALSASFAAIKVYEDSLTKGIVVIKKAEAKTGPNPEQVTLFTMTEGTQVVIKDKENDWFKIESPKSKLGWVPVENILVTTDN